jgi:hypothetical protein
MELPPKRAAARLTRKSATSALAENRSRLQTDRLPLCSDSGHAVSQSAVRLVQKLTLAHSAKQNAPALMREALRRATAHQQHWGAV